MQNLALSLSVTRSGWAGLGWPGDESYPARVRIQEPPPDAVHPHLLHPSASIEENSQHAFPKVDNLLIVLRVGRVCRIVGHGVLLWDRRDDESRVESCKRLA